MMLASLSRNCNHEYNSTLFRLMKINSALQGLRVLEQINFESFMKSFSWMNILMWGEICF